MRLVEMGRCLRWDCVYGGHRVRLHGGSVK
jgi:hypothetical protein